MIQSGGLGFVGNFIDTLNHPGKIIKKIDNKADELLKTKCHFIIY